MVRNCQKEVERKMNKEKYEKMREVMDLLKNTKYDEMEIHDYSNKLTISLSYFKKEK